MARQAKKDIKTSRNNFGASLLPPESCRAQTSEDAPLFSKAQETTMTMYQIEVRSHDRWEKFGEPYYQKSEAQVQRITQLGFLPDHVSRVETVEVANVEGR